MMKHTALIAAASVALGLGVIAAAAPVAAQSRPGVDIQVQKSCNLYPANGPTAIRCRIDVSNIGTVASIAPLTIVDTPGGPAGTTYLGSPTSTFPCSNPPGPMPATLNCGANMSLMPGAPMAGSSSGSTFVDFRLPPTGGAFRNCARASSAQNPTTPGDVNPANNQSCVSITVPPVVTGPPDISVTKACTKGANRSVTCTITITNNGTTASGPLSLTDTLSNVLPVTRYTGAGGTAGASCSAAQNPYAAPVTCTMPAIPGGQTRTVLLAFTVTGNGVFANTVRVSQAGTVPESNVTNNQAMVRVSMP